MTVLHLSFINNEFLLWGESKGICDIKTVRKACRQLAGFSRLPKRNLTVWLPAKGGKNPQPLPSHSLLGSNPPGNYKVRMLPFTAEAVSIDFDKLTDLLLINSAGIPSGTDVILGNSILWAANLFETGMDIVIKELFVPTLEKQDNDFYSRWQPLPDETADRQIKKLQNEMPDVLRCCSKDDENPPAIPREIVLLRMLELIVDNLVWRNITTDGASFKKESVHDAWLNSLISQDRKIKWDNRDELESLYNQISAWNRQVILAVQSPIKLCFRLSEPAADKGKWKLEYLLQSKIDPGIIVPVSALWSKKKDDFETLKKIGFESMELPLMLLGQAAGLYPPIGENLNSGNSSHLSLDSNQVLTFLFEYADILARMGFSVLLPSWWKGQASERKLNLNLKVKSPQLESNAGMGLDRVLQFNYKASLGGEEMTLKELNQLAKMKSPLVKIRGEWVFIDTKEIQGCIDFLKKQGKKELSVNDVVHTALGNSQTPVPVANVRAEGWVGKLLDGLSDKKRFEQLKQPQNFSGKLRHYQRRGYSWLYFLKKWGFGACLADDMGLGKTIQTLALIRRDINNGEKRPVLLICPTTVINNWKKETEKFTPGLTAAVHHGSNRSKGKKFTEIAKKNNLIITSFGLLHRDLDSFKQVNWAGIVVDEAQNIKNSKTKASKAVRSLDGDYRIALTGTPVENHVGDLWSIMEFLNPGLLGNITTFKQRFHKPITLYRDETAAQNLKKTVTPFILRRLKTDKKIIKDLPDKIESKEYCTLTKEQVSLYKAVADEVIAQVQRAEGITRKGLVLSALTRLKQVCNHPVQYYQDNSELQDRSGKLKRTIELLSEIYENGERTLIFTQYYEMGAILQQVLQEHFGKEACFLHGKITKKKRDEMIHRFQNSEDAPFFFILSLKAGGTGITLTKANNVIHYDRWWNPAVEQQATDRAFRIGQHKNVQIHKLIVAGTLEEKIDELILQKEEIANKVVGSGEAFLSELSNTEFKKLITLSQTAQGD